MPAWEELGLLPELVQAVLKMEWHLPSPVQEEAIPLVLGGGDVMTAAPTGTGKTVSF
jgi:ATP-dependent RNA helicase DDX1